MRGRDHVHADVRNRAGESQHEKRRTVAEGGRRQTAGGEQAAPGDERPPALSWRVAPITPPSHDERHGEPGGRVHHHHQPDQSRSLPDVREKQGQVGGRYRPDQTGADRCRGEDDEVGEAASRVERERENAREPSRYERVARDGAPRASRTRACVSSPTAFLPGRLREIRRVSASVRRVPASRPKSEDHARRDSQQPSEDRCGQEDPDQRLPRRSKHPAHLDCTGVGDGKRDQDYEQSDESDGPRIEAGAPCMPAQAVSAGLWRLLSLLRPALRVHVCRS
jgi:hypothetical protein